MKDKTKNDLTNSGEDDRAAPTGDDDGGIAVLSLHRLESELRKLQDKWSSVEEDLHIRDATIAEQNAELELRQANLKSLHDELDNADEERENMRAEVAATHREAEILQQQISKHDDLMADRRRELEELGQQLRDAFTAHEKAVAQSGLLDEEIQKQQKLTAAENAQVISRDKEIQELRSAIHDLEAYIEGRKDSWEKLNVELEDYRNTLVGMEKTVKSREADIHEREDDKSALVRTIIELEQHIAELDGRRLERESMNEQLQTMFEERGQQNEQLSTELEHAKATVEPLRAKNSMREGHVDSLLVDANRQRERIQGLESRLIAANEATKKIEAEFSSYADKYERNRVDSVNSANADGAARLAKTSERVATLESKLASQEQQFVELEQKYDEHQAESVELWAELKQARESLADAEKHMSASDAKVAEFEAESNVFTEEFSTLRDELIMKSQLVAKLEAELSARKETSALLERNVQRLTDIGDDVQALDEKITRETNPKDGPPRFFGSDHDVTRMIVAMTGDRTIRFPLYKKNMTIGRSMDNDIQLRWKYISRNHARIVYNDTGATIEDLGSKNGIFVNKEPVRSFELHDGDYVEIGEVEFQYIELEAQSAAASNS